MEAAAIFMPGGRRRASRGRRSALIASLTAVVVVLLTAGVFSVASTSRQIAVQSARVHTIDEILNTISISRTQFVLASVLADLDQLPEIDTSTALAATTSDLSMTLEALGEASRVYAESFGELKSSSVRAVADVRALIGDVGDRDASGGVLDTTELDIAYALVQELLESERDAAIRDVEAADEALSRLSVLVSFLTAFVIPTVAVVIYRVLAAPQRELLEAEAHIASEAAQAELSRTILLSQLRQLGQDIASHEFGTRDSISTVQRVKDIERTFLSMDRTQVCRFQAVDVRSFLQDIARTETLNIDVSADASAIASSDPAILDLLLRFVMTDSRDRGAAKVSFAATTDQDTVIIKIAHDGAQRPSVEFDLLTSQSNVTDRLSLLETSGVDLVVALHLVANLLGELDFEQAPNHQSVTLRLPAHSGRSANQLRPLAMGSRPG